MSTEAAYGDDCACTHLYEDHYADVGCSVDGCQCMEFEAVEDNR